ncbi:Aromatic-L-amino-acid decarboxylase [Serinicoccus hydrothermalis]|uniref:Aromatic-L-amino-acid decarboxylase n=1 Tax=Serinicoccus hydrothermalis TaxID=1758689 RepID=A0A1B1NFC2_9MICO|nr:aminotransferase class V-fold PLP-dependent enzyme [Serinicoccus hydrothermalis]ANS80099.1 Aromatic-L-amino-acid decarboxylase [Serinicoccus hydrothermalis]
MSSYSRALEVAHEHALHWLGSLGDRPVPPQASIEELITALGPDLPQRGCPPEEAVALLAEASDAGLTATASGRFFGFVVGGTHPAAMAADWLVSAWDQNTGLRTVTPAHSAVEDIASAWLLDLLGLPTESAVGFTTGATMANFTGLAAGREAVLRRAGWDVARHGLAGGPPVRVLVGAERHDTVDVALRYLGLGAPETVAVDDQGRVRPDALEQALAEGGHGPVLVSLQAGNIHSGASDPFEETVAAAHRHGAWVHVDGAFGLWAAASPAYRHLVRGHESADSWATDAHKTLNVPYDSGLCIVRDPAALQAAMGVQGAYLLRDEVCQPLDKVPELSRRGRAVPVWAVLRCLGRDGVAELVERLCHHASTFAEALRAIPGVTVLNDVVFTQVCATFGSDERTDEVVRRLLADGTTWMTGSTWHGQRVLRISVSNWSTTEDDVELSVDAVRRVAREVGGAGARA